MDGNIGSSSAEFATRQDEREKKRLDFVKLTVERPVSDSLVFCMLPELAERFDRQEIGSSYAEAFREYVDEVLTIPIDYPEAPVLKVYILPDDQFQELSGLPIPRGMGGFEDGDPEFPLALCLNEDWFTTATHESLTISDEHRVSNIHELAHIVHGAFFTRTHRVFAEGFAETLPLYLLDYENKCDEHRERISELNEGDIATINGFDGIFEEERAVQPAQSRKSYISAYLLVRGILQKIQESTMVDKFIAANIFLQYMRAIDGDKDFNSLGIFSDFGISLEELLNGKSLQQKARADIQKNHS